MRTRLEKALDTLLHHGIIAAWQYDRWDETCTTHRGWAEVWRHATILIEPPDIIRDHYEAIARQAALAHTGSLVGSEVATEATLKKLGVIRVDTFDDLMETAIALSSTKLPRGRRVAFVSFSGGATGLLSDLAAPFGGSRNSGVGREGGMWSFDFYADVKNVCTAPWND